MLKLENRLLIEIAGAMAVVVSLLFVAYQIQQANRIALAMAEIEIRNNYAQVNELVISDPELTKIFDKGQKNPQDLTDIEKMKLRAWVSRIYNIYSAIDIANANGLATEETYLTMFDDARNELSDEFMRPFWRSNIETFPSGEALEIVQYIIQLLDEYE